jgi:hypothetical protein
MEKSTEVLEVFRGSGTTDQDVIYVDCHPSKIAGQLIHYFLKIAWG